MKRKSRRPRPERKTRRPAPGTAPGHFHFETGEKARLHLYSYDEKELVEEFPDTLLLAKKSMGGRPGHKHWLQITGLGNTEFFQELRDLFGIHPVELEGVLTGNSRPKMEVHRGKVFDISRILYYNEEQVLVDEQFNLFYFDSTLISIQEAPANCFNPLKERIRKEGTLLRRSPAFYLYYAISDAIIDNYFPLLESLENRLEVLEDALFDRPRRQHISDIQLIRRDLLTLRKTLGAEKENLTELIRNLDPENREKFGLYLQDAYDHCMHITDLIESQKEIAFSLVDIYLSSTNNRMNEIMKVLTVVTSIFIPLSFVVGLYGMNFSPESKTGEALPLNMPELYHPYGYPVVVGIMFLIAVVQLIFFRKKGWI